MNYCLRAAVAGCVAIGLVGCSTWEGLSQREKGTAIGAAVGGVAGAVATDSALGTVGGAAVGGVIGHEVGKRREEK